MMNPEQDDTLPDTDAEAAAPRPLRPGDLSEAIPLRDALLGIGEVMQLPRKRATSPSGMAAIGEAGASGERTLSRNTKTIGMPAIPEPTYGELSRRETRTWLAGGAFALSMLVALVAWLGSGSERLDPMPTALKREWRTAHPDYAHTMLTFTDTSVVIVTRDLTSDDPDRPIHMPHRITGLSADRIGNEMEVVVRYLVEGEPDQLRVRLLAGVEPELSFERPEGLRWYPSAPPGGP